ncbi:MAG TPA: hypothetical protein VNE58_14095 [Casimicrobiaceae bacterium]|nr:hypothetical protein [Casimicrobiaceae bacterium]
MEATSFDETVRIFDARNARSLASELFRENFGADFPSPRDACGLPIPTPAENWHQYVALYRWPDGRDETVGFCNFIRHGHVYLEGGMCVKKGFYKRLSRDHFRRCKALGGVAEMMMRQAAEDLADCVAWFGYCGDRRALAVDLRAGYEPTAHEHLIVKWFAVVASDERDRLIDQIARIGPF